MSNPFRARAYSYAAYEPPFSAPLSAPRPTPSSSGITRQIAWKPQPGPQQLLMVCPYEEIFYGGARGGGKTSGLLGHWIKHQARWGAHARGIIFRRTLDELEEVMEQSEALFPKIGGRYIVGKKTWLFPNTAKLLFRFIESDMLVRKYQGRAYTWMGMEEVTNWASEDVIDRLKGSLRSGNASIQCQWVGTGNPGGVGHNWVKARFIDPMPPMTPYRDPKTGIIRIFIPAKLIDNKILMANDPGYVNRLRSSGPEWLVKAWLDGNWNIVAGGMFDDVWSAETHILKPFIIPKNWVIERSFDWGSSKPFSVGWWATANGEQVPGQRHFAPGTKIRIAEYYGWNGIPNKGIVIDTRASNTIKSDVDVARKIKEIEAQMKREYGYQIQQGPADPSIFTVINGQSIASIYSKEGISFKPAATGPGSRVSGWALMRTMLSAAKQPRMEDPGLFVFDTCRQFIRTVPVLPRDMTKVDDVDTDAEDHIGDETRYALTTKRSTITIKPLAGL